MINRVLNTGLFVKPIRMASYPMGNFSKFRGFHKGSDLRRKTLIFKCMNTGMKELDIILGEFIKENPEILENEANELESFLEMDTCSIYDIVMGKKDHSNNMAKKIREFATNQNKNKKLK